MGKKLFNNYHQWITCLVMRQWKSNRQGTPKSFFYGDMPEKLSAEFYKRYQLEEHSFIKELYSQSRPNRYLATFALFAAEFRGDIFVEEIIKKCFNSHIYIQLHKLHERSNPLPLYFIGSIASGFEKKLRQLMCENSFEVADVQKSPFPKLLDYY